MPKLTLNDLVNLQNEISAVSSINNNNGRIESALENTLSRDGTIPNQMEADLDMNSFRILNLPPPVTDAEPLRFSDLQDFLDGDLTINISNDYTSQVRNRFLQIGDSLTANNTSSSVNVKSYTSQGWLPWASKLFGQRMYYDVALNKGVGGETSEQVRARFATDVAPNAASFDWVTILAGHNDISVVTSDRCIENLKYLVEQSVLLGKGVLLLTLLPDGSGGAAVYHFYAKVNTELRRWISTTTFTTPVLLVDSWLDLADPNSVLGVPETTPISVQPDTVHQGSAGGYRIGRRVAEQLARFLPRISTLGQGEMDSYDATQNPKGNLLLGSQFSGGGGTIVHGTGSLATNFVLVKAGGSTWLDSEVVASLESHLGGFGSRQGNTQVISVNIAGGKTATETIVFFQECTIPNDTSKYYCTDEIDWYNLSPNLVEASLSIFDGTQSYSAVDGAPAPSPAPGYHDVDDLIGLQFRTPPNWTPPAGATQAWYIRKFVFDCTSLPATGVFKINSPQLRIEGI